MTESRVLPLGGIHNFRDYGGYRTLSGAVIPRGRLFRSGHLSYATKSDIDRLSAIELDLIVDLRSDVERRTDPSLVGPVAGGILAFIPDAHGETPHLSSTFLGLSTRQEAINGMKEIYSSLPFNPANQLSFGLYLNSLAECQSASLVHCFAGKDRTGLTVALFHQLMGVSENDIYQDYMLTNAAGDNRMNDGIAALRAKYDLDLSDEVLEEVMLVRPEYLATAFAQMSSRFGSIEDYIVNGLGVSPGNIRQLRAEYSE
ncbi:tyrosine-protein phosphatase [Sphingorhabdus sp.]|jgi:protein tyrosine/serine phosphatase|uniref:tyrosine-protein phosphatase n=1 Tax=Sphingorhabdus sp. TaxID=1902408 RepID=UPI002619D3ED|nr:tyrosine-protein phosphatase [Sphingorhabdus sp.]